MSQPKFPGIRTTTNGNQLVAYHTEARITEAGVFYPITPSTEMGEMYQLSYAEGRLNVWGGNTTAIETEGEHAAQAGAIAVSTTGKRTVNFTSGQGIVYGLEQYYHAPGKLSSMVLEVGARALTKHALNVHCGHDDIYAALDTGWIMTVARDAQQAADQAVILRKVTELALNPGMNIMDGFLTTHLERTFFKCESELLRQFLGAPSDEIDCPTPAQRTLFGPTRRRVPKSIDLTSPALLGPVQNQEHYMNGVIARRNHFAEPILGFIEAAYAEFAELTGREYGLIRQYNCEGADTVFISLGSAAENIEAGVDWIAEHDGVTVGSIHINVLRPFPDEVIVSALAGRTNVIILERTDEPLSGDNPLTRDIRAALSRAVQAGTLANADVPRIFSASYGLGSRDFRPEGILGAYEFVTGRRARDDGKTRDDGVTYFTIGINHPYNVTSDRTPSLLPDGAIAIRLHSIGGWGMITTGKNLGAIIGEFGDDLAKERAVVDAFGRPEEVLHISANPRYGSEKKGAPTAYFLVVAPKRVRVNCDLNHVDVVLCCDPKAFTHTNPLVGLKPNGAFVWESDQDPSVAWQQIPQHCRQQIIDNNIRVYILPGFAIARAATERPELQLRMQGNAFLGAFFGTSSFLKDYDIDEDRFKQVVRAQYTKKFGRFGDAVVDSNMRVMEDGFKRIIPVPHGDVDAPDQSDMRGDALLPIACAETWVPRPEGQPERIPLHQTKVFDAEFRAGLGYNQPASPLAATGVIVAATGATNSKYVARRETPVYIEENCTQCMDCITVCPDTALPNTTQDLDTILLTAIGSYVVDPSDRQTLIDAVPSLQAAARAEMLKAVAAKRAVPFAVIIDTLVSDLGVSRSSQQQLRAILDALPASYFKTKALFGSAEKREAGSGGLFSIFVSDLCKGCGACVVACGSHEALVMMPDSELLNANVMTGTSFLDLLPRTQDKYLGKYDRLRPAEVKAGVLKNHLMLLETYRALVSGDGACAGCGEKSVLRAVATITEAFMRPLYHAKATRLNAKADQLEAGGAAMLSKLGDPGKFREAVARLLMGLGGEDDADSAARLQDVTLTDTQVVDALVAVLRQDAFNHRELQTVDGRDANGMAVMAMTAHTGCNTVYGSTPPNNPHPYPWMNSLFQDGATIGWTVAESFIATHARRSVVPERLTDALLAGQGVDDDDLWDLAHLNDALMTDDEVLELPKVWAIGGDGGMGDIGFQNVSKVIMQNRPNVKVLMLDTQVYSNTGGQNSDSSPMPGGADMNSFGRHTQGKLVEKKSVAEILTNGHGSPFVAQVSMAGPLQLFKALLDGLEYRGSAFFQCFTTCQPEHGVGDDMSGVQANRIRDSRGMPEFTFDPRKGERYDEAISLRGNPNLGYDWATKKLPTGERYPYTTAHWATTEARFRRHFKRVGASDVAGKTELTDMLARVTQQDVVQRWFYNREHRAYIPDWGVYTVVETNDGEAQHVLLSRQMVLFCVERRKAWRLLQSRAGVVNKDYLAQKAALAKVVSGEIALDDFLARSAAIVAEQG